MAALSPIAGLQARPYTGTLWSVEIEAGLRLLLELLVNVGPREWRCSRPLAETCLLFGDASEPSDDNPWCAAMLVQGSRTSYFAVRVPDSVLRALRPRHKQIAVMELLWVVLSLVVWSTELRDSMLMVFEDNNSAERGLTKGMSRHSDINALLSLFWCSAAQLHANCWFEHIASADNPVDCLTKPGLNRSHLTNAADVTRSLHWEVVFVKLCSMLESNAVPSWSSCMDFLFLGNVGFQ